MVGGQTKSCYRWCEAVKTRKPGEGGKRAGVKWRRGQVRARRLFNRLPLQEIQKLHLLTFLIGGLGGLAAVAFHWLLEAFQNGIIYRGAGTADPWRAPLLIVVPASAAWSRGPACISMLPKRGAAESPRSKRLFSSRGDGSRSG
jgi:hypothetical protein